MIATRIIVPIMGTGETYVRDLPHVWRGANVVRWGTGPDEAGSVVRTEWRIVGDGDFVVVWLSSAEDGHRTRLLAQGFRYNGRLSEQ